MKKPIIILICLLLLSAIIAASIIKQRSQLTPQQKPDADAQDMIFYTLDGEKMSYEEAISPSKTVLFLWTSTCDVCKDTLIYLSKRCSLYKDINVLYLNIGESQILVEDFLSHYGIASCILKKTLLDVRSRIRGKFLIIGVPTVIFFKDGTPVDASYTLNEYLIRRVYGDS